jgi:preprotein translocase subunit SecA
MALTFGSQYDKRGFFKAGMARRFGRSGKAGRGKNSDRARLGRIEAMADDMAALDDEELRAKADKLKQGIRSGNLEIDDVMEEGFALAREASRRVRNLFPFPEQILAGLTLVRGGVAEMATGEGKTLAIVLPAFVFALLGEGVHVVTVNSYLAERDHEFVRPIFGKLGLTCGLLPEREAPPVKRAEYNHDITYGVGYEFGFDYMRDQLALLRCPRPGPRELLRDALLGTKAALPELCQRQERAFCIIDEVDSVLIDEAGSPLVISEAVNADGEVRDPYDRARDLAELLEVDHHYRYDAPERRIELTVSGSERIHDCDQIPWEMLRRPWESYVMNALKARILFLRDVHYVVDAEDKVVIVDEFTGRRHEERTWREGLHQAVESKEGVEIRSETETAASITRQRYFRLYDRMCGLTGTAAESAGEFWRFFEMPVEQIPLHKPCIRKIEPERVFQTQAAMFDAILADLQERHARGQPVLVGTRNIRVSEQIAERLEAVDLPHRVLTAKQDEEESDIVASAGEAGSILIATNMAGRGTHIDLTPESEAAGGLHVMVVERNDSVRIDRQLYGRGARQGQPGSTQFFVSAEDFLMENHGKEAAKKMQRTKADEYGQLPGKFSRLFDEVQEKVELQRYEARLQMDERDRWVEDTRRSLA